MSGATSIREAILQQAEKEAERIIGEAQEKAKQVLQTAQRQKNGELERTRLDAIEEANRLNERVQAEARSKTRKIILEQKKKVLAKITEDVRKLLEARQFRYDAEQSIRSLLADALIMFPEKAELHVTVNARDMAAAKKILRELGLSESTTIKSTNDILGGTIIESADSLLRVDNSFDARLRSYMRVFLPEISKALFES